MNWIPLTEAEQLEDIKSASSQKPQVIFKHSTRCSISSVALRRMERAAAIPEADFYLLDLIANRSLSNQIAETFQVHHESPQVLLIRNGSCTYEESHYGIEMEAVSEAIA